MKYDLTAECNAVRDDGNFLYIEAQALRDQIKVLTEALVEIRDKRHSQSFTIDQAAEIARAALEKYQQDSPNA